MQWSPYAQYTTRTSCSWLKRIKWIPEIVHDEFTPEDVWDIVEIFSEVMALEAHGQIFCALLQFGGWNQTLLAQQAEVSGDKLCRVTRVLLRNHCLRSRQSHCIGQGHLEIIPVTLDRSVLTTPRWMSLWYISGELVYVTLTSWSALTTKQRGTYPVANRHWPTRWTTLLGCRRLRLWMDLMT